MVRLETCVYGRRCWRLVLGALQQRPQQRRPPQVLRARPRPPHKVLFPLLRRASALRRWDVAFTLGIACDVISALFESKALHPSLCCPADGPGGTPGQGQDRWARAAGAPLRTRPLSRSPHRGSAACVTAWRTQTLRQQRKLWQRQKMHFDTHEPLDTLCHWGSNFRTSLLGAPEPEENDVMKTTAVSPAWEGDCSVRALRIRWVQHSRMCAGRQKCNAWWSICQLQLV